MADSNLSLAEKQFSEKETQFYLETIRCNHSRLKMNHLRFIVSDLKGESIICKKGSHDTFANVIKAPFSYKMVQTFLANITVISVTPNVVVSPI